MDRSKSADAIEEEMAMKSERIVFCANYKYFTRLATVNWWFNFLSTPVYTTKIVFFLSHIKVCGHNKAKSDFS